MSEELNKEELITQTFKDIESYTDKCSEDELSKLFKDVQIRYSKLGFKGVDDEYAGSDKIAIIWLMEMLIKKVIDGARHEEREKIKNKLMKCKWWVKHKKVCPYCQNKIFNWLLKKELKP